MRFRTKRLAVLGLVCAAAPACPGIDGPAAVLPAAPASAATPPRAELQSLVCQRSLDPSGRSVAITAVMRPVSGTYRLAIKFDLERRPDRAVHFTTVRGRDLGKWVYPTNPPTLGQVPGDVWMLKHNVVNLTGPAHYRFRVAFRWTEANGRVLASEARVSPACHQPELRADLQVRSISIKSAAAAGQDRYVAVVYNAGATAAAGFTVELKARGSTPQSLFVSSLGPQATVREAFDAPACPAGSPVTLIADPARQVDEANRANNVLTVPCPSDTAP